MGCGALKFLDKDMVNLNQLEFMIILEKKVMVSKLLTILLRSKKT